ncbi:MAG: Sec62 family protein translocation protein [archaeon]|nr:Sec62 family protein translocation protein [archaeon]
MENNNNPNTASNEKISEEERVKEFYLNLSKFWNDIVDEQKLVTKQANLMGKKRITYCKGKELLQYYKDNFNYIQENINKLSEGKINLGKEANEQSFNTFFNVCVNFKLLIKVSKGEGDKAKYPKRLFLPRKDEDIHKFEEMKFYWINTQTETSKKSIIILGILIFVIFACCLFPVWPLKLKIAVLWILFTLLVSLLVFMILTLVIAYVGVIFGYDIIVMPNLIEPKMRWRDRLFNPFVAYYPREDDWMLKVVRVFMGLGTVSVIIVAIYYPALFRISYDYSIGLCKRLYSYTLDKLILAPERRKNELRKRQRDNLNFDF